MSEDKRCRWCGADDTAESITEDILAHESNCPKTLGRMASKLAEERAEDVRAVDALTERVEQVESDLRAAGIAGAGVWQQEEEDRQECPSSDARERARKVLEEMLDPATDGKKFVNPADAILDALEGEGIFDLTIAEIDNIEIKELERPAPSEDEVRRIIRHWYQDDVPEFAGWGRLMDKLRPYLAAPPPADSNTTEGATDK